MLVQNISQQIAVAYNYDIFYLSSVCTKPYFTLAKCKYICLLPLMIAALHLSMCAATYICFTMININLCVLTMDEMSSYLCIRPGMTLTLLHATDAGMQHIHQQRSLHIIHLFS